MERTITLSEKEFREMESRMERLEKENSEIDKIMKSVEEGGMACIVYDFTCHSSLMKEWSITKYSFLGDKDALESLEELHREEVEKLRAEKDKEIERLRKRRFKLW